MAMLPIIAHHPENTENFVVKVGNEKYKKALICSNFRNRKSYFTPFISRFEKNQIN